MEDSLGQSLIDCVFTPTPYFPVLFRTFLRAHIARFRPQRLSSNLEKEKELENGEDDFIEQGKNENEDEVSEEQMNLERSGDTSEEIAMWTALRKAGVMRRWERAIREVAEQSIEEQILSTARGEFRKPLLSFLLHWTERVAIAWARTLLGGPCLDLTAHLLSHVYDTFGKLRFVFSFNLFPNIVQYDMIHLSPLKQTE
jgi:hypothetical protein